uniref:Uncharacterized protein n=1 Tax=Noctiluca scintillans TaxID=2966 RepID=A0A7S1FJY3_NOCSC|mmetsp:Transcript_7892/g.21738  ORF Transcript_7892/g.21738 Transcript_7892/m.21738 type:complete len:648 (+) Transcript_7892:154-2097(+)
MMSHRGGQFDEDLAALLRTTLSAQGDLACLLERECFQLPTEPSKPLADSRWNIRPSVNIQGLPTLHETSQESIITSSVGSCEVDDKDDERVEKLERKVMRLTQCVSLFLEQENCPHMDAGPINNETPGKERPVVSRRANLSQGVHPISQLSLDSKTLSKVQKSHEEMRSQMRRLEQENQRLLEEAREARHRRGSTQSLTESLGTMGSYKLLPPREFSPDSSRHEVQPAVTGGCASADTGDVLSKSASPGKLDCRNASSVAPSERGCFGHQTSSVLPQCTLKSPSGSPTVGNVKRSFQRSKHVRNARDGSSAQDVGQSPRSGRSALSPRFPRLTSRTGCHLTCLSQPVLHTSRQATPRRGGRSLSPESQRRDYTFNSQSLRSETGCDLCCRQPVPRVRRPLSPWFLNRGRNLGDTSGCSRSQQRSVSPPMHQDRCLKELHSSRSGSLSPPSRMLPNKSLFHKAHCETARSAATEDSSEEMLPRGWRQLVKRVYRSVTGRLLVDRVRLVDVSSTEVGESTGTELCLQCLLRWAALSASSEEHGEDLVLFVINCRDQIVEPSQTPPEPTPSDGKVWTVTDVTVLKTLPPPESEVARCRDDVASVGGKLFHLALALNGGSLSETHRSSAGCINPNPPRTHELSTVGFSTTM